MKEPETPFSEQNVPNFVVGWFLGGPTFVFANFVLSYALGTILEKLNLFPDTWFPYSTEFLTFLAVVVIFARIRTRNKFLSWGLGIEWIVTCSLLVCIHYRTLFKVDL